jgi:hypothetical protein
MLLRLWVIILSALLLCSCSSLLPRSKKVTESRWNSYEQVRMAYNEVTPYKTTRKDLKKLGFSPYQDKNIKIRNFLQIHKAFDPLMTFHNLSPAIANCLKQENRCVEFYVDVENMHSKRIGNAALDLLNFKRTTESTGWYFRARIILLDDLVVFKTSSSSPSLKDTTTKVNPLGPIQNGVNIGVEYLLDPL